ncbi:MAG: hypothetical protein Q4A83_01885 [Bacillota bacterium]|nr:hypothetical protein [Bacillota bacterium]
MDFIKKRGSDTRKKQCESLYLLPALMILLGASASFFLISYDAFAAACAKTDGCIFIIACIFLLLLIFASGLNLAGSVTISCLDFIFGVAAVLLTESRACGIELFSGVWFFWAICIFTFVSCALHISSSARRFSAVILGKLKADTKFRAKLVKFAGLCLAVILIITSAFILIYRFKPEFFI